jgi:hypothetical protein
MIALLGCSSSYAFDFRGPPFTAGGTVNGDLVLNGTLDATANSVITSSFINAFKFRLDINAPSNSSASYRAGSFNASITGSSDYTVGPIGVIKQITHGGTGTVGFGIGSSYTVSNTSTGTITEGEGIRLSHSNTGGGTFTEYNGIYFADSATGATTRYAFHFDSNFASNSRAVKSELGSSAVYMPLSTADTGITYDSTDVVLATTTSGDVELNPAGDSNINNVNIFELTQEDVGSTCTLGQIRYDTGGATDELCICQATDTWMCVALASGPAD